MSLLAHLAEPVTFVAVFLLVGTVHAFVAVPRGRIRRVVWVWAGIFVVYMTFATPLGANALLRPLEEAAGEAASRCKTGGGAPAIAVVLAGGAESGAATAADYQYLSEGSLRRTIVAAQWAKADASRRLLLSGGYGVVSEARLMAGLLLDLGIPATRIDLDGDSVNTAQSARNVAARLRRTGAGQVLVITSADHMARALAELQGRGVPTCALPVDFQYVAPIFPGHLVPQINALTKSTRALHEHLGLLLRRLRGDV